MRLPVQSYDLDDPASTASLINCYVESLPEDARAPYLIKRCPGIKPHVTATSFQVGLINGPIRRAMFFEAAQRILIVTEATHIGNLLDSAYAGPGTILMWVDSGRQTNTAFNGTATILTTLIDEYAKNIDLDQNADVAIFVTEPNAYTVATDGTITILSDTDFTSRGAGDVEFLDNFLLYREPRSGRFFGSDIGSATVFDPLKFSTAEAVPDWLVGMQSDHSQLALFGSKSLELWDSTSGRGFPFRRVINGSIEKGCISKDTIALVDDQLFWVADDRTVRTLSGLTPIKVSHSAIDKTLSNDKLLATTTNAFSYSYDGHSFYVLRGSDYCFVYDVTTGMWHNRKSYGHESWKFGCSVNAWGNTYFGADVGHDNTVTRSGSSTASATHGIDGYHFGIMDSKTYDDGDEPMLMQWTYQPVFGAGQRVFHDRMEIVLKTGVGNADITDPTIVLEWSDDGGQHWKNMPPRSIGKMGQSKNRVVWHGLGSAYDRVYRASIVDPIDVMVTDTILTARGGRV